MSASQLVVFPSSGEPESPADRIRRLQNEARTLAREHIEMLASALHEVARLSGEIADGGRALSGGRARAVTPADRGCGKHALTLTAIVDRN